MTKKHPGYPIRAFLAAWSVHLFTASAACLGLFTLISIHHHEYQHALWFMAATVVIDALDGSLARWLRVKEILPRMDGALLDNIVDYLNYVVTPCFFLYIKSDMLPTTMVIPVLIGIILTSSYQFCQTDAKTPDHFFKGFPCYWNIAVFYMFLFETPSDVNTIIFLVLCILVFVPIKYVYPSRLDYLTSSRKLKRLMYVFSIVYGISSSIMLWTYPLLPPIYLVLSLLYILIYLSLSVYRTWFPLTEHEKIGP